MKQRSSSQTGQGFSLVEMLVVIAVIGILAAISIPNIGKDEEAAKSSKDRRNAQQLAAVCGASQAAGQDFVDPAGDGWKNDTLEAVISRVVEGGRIEDETSPFNGTYFGVPNLSPKEQEGVAKHLSIESGLLTYTPDKSDQ